MDVSEQRHLRGPPVPKPKEAERKPVTLDQIVLFPWNALFIAGLSSYALSVGMRRAMVHATYVPSNPYGEVIIAFQKHALEWSEGTFPVVINAATKSWYAWRDAVSSYFSLEKPSKVD